MTLTALARCGGLRWVLRALLWCGLLAAPAAQAQFNCAPSVNPNLAIVFQNLTLLANCDAAVGPATEVWTISCPCAATITVTRLPGAPLATVHISTANTQQVSLNVQPATGSGATFTFSFVVQRGSVALPPRLAAATSGTSTVAVQGALQRQLALPA